MQIIWKGLSVLPLSVLLCDAALAGPTSGGPTGGGGVITPGPTTPHQLEPRVQLFLNAGGRGAQEATGGSIFGGPLLSNTAAEQLRQQLPVTLDSRDQELLVQQGNLTNARLAGLRHDPRPARVPPRQGPVQVRPLMQRLLAPEVPFAERQRLVQPLPDYFLRETVRFYYENPTEPVPYVLLQGEKGEQFRAVISSMEAQFGPLPNKGRFNSSLFSPSQALLERLEDTSVPLAQRQLLVSRLSDDMLRDVLMVYHQNPNTPILAALRNGAVGDRVRRLVYTLEPLTAPFPNPQRLQASFWPEEISGTEAQVVEVLQHLNSRNTTYAQEIALVNTLSPAQLRALYDYLLVHPEVELPFGLQRSTEFRDLVRSLDPERKNFPHSMVPYSSSEAMQADVAQAISGTMDMIDADAAAAALQRAMLEMFGIDISQGTIIETPTTPTAEGTTPAGNAPAGTTTTAVTTVVNANDSFRANLPKIQGPNGTYLVK